MTDQNGTQRELQNGDLVYILNRKKEKVFCIFDKINGSGQAYMHTVENRADQRRTIDKVFFPSDSEMQGVTSIPLVEQSKAKPKAKPRIVQVVNIENSNDAKKREMLAKFSINKRFSILKSLVKLTAIGKRNALIVTGKGGLGKTYSVREALMSIGMKRHRLDISDGLGEDGEAVDSVEIIRDSKEWAEEGEDGDYIVIGGSLTVKGLYDIMFEHRNKLLIFDDCDDIWKTKKMSDILKNGLDNKKERFISWAVSGSVNQFQFFGQIIFISNLNKNSMDQAVMTRCSTVDVSMTADEMIERMQTIIESDKYMQEIPMDIKAECLALIEENKLADGISMRTLEEVIIYRTEDPDEWRDLAEYSIYS